MFSLFSVQILKSLHNVSTHTFSVTFLETLIYALSHNSNNNPLSVVMGGMLAILSIDGKVGSDRLGQFASSCMAVQATEYIPVLLNSESLVFLI